MKPYAAASGAALGSWLLLPVSPAVLAAATVLWVWRRSALTVLLLFVAATGFIGNRAVAGLVAPAESQVEGWVTLLDDPRPLGPNGIRLTVRHQGKRLDARAHGLAAGRLDDALAGERVEISGAIRALGSDWQRWRHIVGELDIAAVHRRSPAAPLLSLTNGIRRLLSRGARSLSRDDRSLFTGMVFGDDRDQSARLADDFRAAGLGHLLVVSGQNVAFVLALASPLACRLRPAGRVLALCGVLAVFALLTRFEPSVLRAVAMAGVAVMSAAMGRPRMGRRTLAAALAVVLLVDPFLIRVLGFQLSVCASAGIIWLTPKIVPLLRGPHLLRLAAATTAGAQLAVMPLLIITFGSVPVASLPANMLAGPASGPVMMWGFTAGLAAGILGGSPAWLIHLPTAFLLWWVRTVAAAAALAPPAVLGAGGALAVAGGAALVLAGRGPTRWIRRLGSVTVLVTLLVSIAVAPTPPQGWSDVAGAAVLHHGESTVVVLDAPSSPRGLLESLRQVGVRDIDLLVAAGGRAADANAVVALLDRYGEVPVAAPPLHRVPHGRTVTAGKVIELADLKVRVVADSPKLMISGIAR